MQDLRYALRTLRKQPVFTIAALVTLTLGVGANAAIFSLLYQVLLRPLPFPDEHRLVWVWNRYGKAGEERTAVSIPDYLDRKSQADAIEDATLFTGRAVALTGGAQPEQLRALAVTPSFFATLGRPPMLGRGFTSEDAQPNADRFVVLTYATWRSRYDADPAAVGRDMRLNGEAWRIVGVMAPDVILPLRDIAVLVPFAFTPVQMSDAGRGNEFSFMIARLRPGATIAQLDQQMAAIVDRTIARVPARAAFMRNTNFGGAAVPLHDRLVGDTRTPLYVLQASVVVVLLIACANVANLLLMRANRRSRELAIRAALGAGRARIARQLVVEGLVLATGGAAAGLVAGLWGLRALVAMTADQLPFAADASLHLPVLVFTAGLAVATGVVFGLAPALGLLRGSMGAGLRDDSGRATGGRRAGLMRASLVVAETALALVLLVGAGLLIKSFSRVLTVDPGFSSSHVLTAQVAIPRERYPTVAAQQAFWAALVPKLRELPGVVAAGMTSIVPFSGLVSAGTYGITGRPVGPTEKPPHAMNAIVAGDYFRALQIPVLEGRVFDDRDGPNRPFVVVVDDFLARRQFPGRSAIGERLNFGGARNYEIIGVVGTINVADLALPVPEERLYLPAMQQGSLALGLIIKTAVDPARLVAPLRAAVQSVDPDQPIADVRTMDEWLSRSLEPRRAPMTLLALFGASALALAAIGIYGVLAFAVTERAREFGIRQALGADRSAILSLVLTQGLRTAGAGVAIGVAGSFVVTRYLQSMLFGVERYDLGVLSGVAGLLLIVALCACYVPARWATRVDPVAALRQE